VKAQKIEQIGFDISRCPTDERVFEFMPIVIGYFASHPEVQITDNLNSNASVGSAEWA
jgi:hypothetical protein